MKTHEIEQNFELWYEKNQPPEGAYDSMQLVGLKVFAKHAYLKGYLRGLTADV